MSNNPKTPPSHVLQTAVSLTKRDVQAVKTVYQQLFIEALNSDSFYDNIGVIDVSPFDDSTLRSLPAPPPLVSSNSALPPSPVTSQLSEERGVI